MLFVCYPKCSTCQKAQRFLQEHGIDVQVRHIVEERPNEAELAAWIERSGLPIKRFFNTSGLVYKELQLKDKLPEMSREEQIALLASNGMLVKRPLLLGEDFVLVGFRQKEWEARLLDESGR